MLTVSANQITGEDGSVMGKSRKSILERDQTMEDITHIFIMELETEKEADFLNREDSLLELYKIIIIIIIIISI